MEQEQDANVRSSSSNSAQKNPSARFEALVSELIQKRPDLNRASLFELVKQKKSKVGGGFLTDQGALFLVAADLGVALKPIFTPKAEAMTTNEDAGNALSLAARILSIGSPKTFTRRSDSTEGFLGKVVLYDAASSYTVSVWDKDVFFRIIESNFTPGDSVKVTGLSRRNPENSANSSGFSLNDNGGIERRVGDENFERTVPSISQKSLDPSRIASLPLGLASIVRGRIASPVRSSEFNRKDGTRSRYVSFSIDSTNVENRDGGAQNEIRVVVWDNSNPIFDKLQVGDNVTLLNVKTKESDFSGTRVLELHGDDSTHILEHWEKSRIWLEGQFTAVSKRLAMSGATDPLGSKSAQQQQQRQKIVPFVGRVLSAGKESTVADKSASAALHLLLIDSSKRKISVTALSESCPEAMELQIDDVIICKPDSFDQMGLRATCSKKGSLSRVKPERNDIPKSSTLVSTIDSLEPDSISSVDCMILSVSPARDIQTKEGFVKRSEATIADPTGEIKLYAWRSLARLLEVLTPGTRLMLRGVEVQSHEGKKFLVFKNYTRIEIVSS